MIGDAIRPVLSEQVLSELDGLLAPADSLLSRYPGERVERQPVHTAYVPADRFVADLAQDWGRQALAALDRHAADPLVLAGVLGVDPAVAGPLVERVRRKLGAEPIEDLRLDFEDGYGVRPDAVEDADATRSGALLAAAVAAGTAPEQVGIRFKSLEPQTRRRGLRTLDLFLGALLAGGDLPPGFVLTLPKVTSVQQVTAMAAVCGHLEAAHLLPPGRLRFEVQVETPQAVLGPDGVATVARIVHASGRISGLHYGTYDYSAALGIAAAYQSMEHPAADHAKAVMQVAAAGTGVRLSDGSVNVLPIGDRAAVLAAWRLHARLVRRSLERGYYQGWDLHPAQLPTRFAATFAFFLDGLPAAAERLRGYLRRLDGGVLDEPATAAALAGFLLRGLQCGATDDAAVTALTALTRSDLERLARRQPTGP